MAEGSDDADSKVRCSHGGHSAVKANLGANEGHLFLLDKQCLYISKNPLYIPYNDITEIRFERVSGALTSSARTFDLVIATRSGKNEHQFSAVAKDEQTGIEDFLKRDKKLRVKNVMDQDANVVNSAVVAALMEDDSSDSDAPRRAAGDEDEDSEVDEDFKAGSDDEDVAEEFNEVRRSASAQSVVLTACFCRITLAAHPALRTAEAMLVAGTTMTTKTCRRPVRLLKRAKRQSRRVKLQGRRSKRSRRRRIDVMIASRL